MGDIRIINVGGDNIGISGLDQAVADMAAEFADRSDQEVAAEMLTRLEPRNYFSAQYLDEYTAALVGYFHRHLGQPHEAQARHSPKVNIPKAACSCMKG